MYYTLIVLISEPPVKFVNKEGSNKVSAYESESVTLSAVVNWKTANVRWLKDGHLLDRENMHISSEGETHKLTINPLQLSDSGEYVCDVNTDEMCFSLLVKGKNAVLFVFKLIIHLTSHKTAQQNCFAYSEMMVKFIKPLENSASVRGSSLTLRCEISKLTGDVQWLKDGQEISSSCRHTIRAQGRERSITIFQLVEEDSGVYVCVSTHDNTTATVTVESEYLSRMFLE